MTPSLLLKTWTNWLGTSQRRLLVQEDGVQVCTSIVFPIPCTAKKICGEGRDWDGVVIASVPWALFVKAQRGKMILRQNLEQVLDTVVSVLGWHSLSTVSWSIVLTTSISLHEAEWCLFFLPCIGLSACVGHDLGAFLPSVRAEQSIRGRREWPWGVFLTVTWNRSYYHMLPYLCLFIPA